MAQGIVHPTKAEVNEEFLRLDSIPMDTLLQPAPIGLLVPIQNNRP
jgi:hypothetical protein